MTTYSTASISYITLQLISLLLLSCLMFIILKSKPYFTKWTLFQICVTAYGGGLTNLPLIILYGDELVDRAFDNSLCIILQKISLYFLYPFEFNCCVLAFYLWYALVKRNLDIEKKCFWYITSAIWIFATIYNAILLKFASKEDHWGVLAGSLDCKNSKILSSFYGYMISTSILALLAILMTGHSAFILYKRWSHFSVIKNRRTAIRLGEAVRLWIWCFTFVLTLTIPLIPRAILSEESIPDFTTVSRISSFGAASVGTLLFLIFGTNKKAAYFLPCYYVPPEKLQPTFSLPADEHAEAEISDANVKPNVNDVDEMIHFNDKGSNQTLCGDFSGSSHSQ